jgi:5-deoxy-D-glucuronate isomerase
MACGRIRKAIGRGYTQLIDTELAMLKFAMISLEEGDSFTFETKNREYGCLLISGKCRVLIGNGLNGTLGPRANPWKEKAWAILVTRDERVTFKACCKTLIAVGSAPAAKKCPTRS